MAFVIGILIGAIVGYLIGRCNSVVIQKGITAGGDVVGGNRPSKKKPETWGAQFYDDE